MPQQQPLVPETADYQGISLALDELLIDYAQGRAPHALIISGVAGLLKSDIAHHLARSLLCTASDKPCGECAACKRAISGSHGNLLVVERQRKDTSLKIEQTRRLLDALSLTPLEEGPRTIIILEVDTMTPAAQNALLKSLEEPERTDSFILTTKNEQAVLSTVLSRCRVLRLFAWPAERMQALLERRGYTADEARELAKNAPGLPGAALAVAQNKKADALQDLAARTFFSVRTLSDIPPASMLLKDARDSAGPLLDLLEQEAHVAIQSAFSGGHVYCKTGWQGASPGALRVVLEEIHQARRYRFSNVSWQAIADRLLFTITKEIHQCQWS
jgi:replication-associated recombination protein RarA